MAMGQRLIRQMETRQFRTHAGGIIFIARWAVSLRLIPMIRRLWDVRPEPFQHSMLPGTMFFAPLTRASTEGIMEMDQVLPPIHRTSLVWAFIRRVVESTLTLPAIRLIPSLPKEEMEQMALVFCRYIRISLQTL